jgi:hypothetical protein
MAKSGLGFRLVQISSETSSASMAVQQKNLGGGSWSYFPLEDYIDWLRKLMPPTTDIKFGL